MPAPSPIKTARRQHHMAKQLPEMPSVDPQRYEMEDETDEMDEEELDDEARIVRMTQPAVRAFLFRPEIFAEY